MRPEILHVCVVLTDKSNNHISKSFINSFIYEVNIDHFVHVGNLLAMLFLTYTQFVPNNGDS